MTPSWLRRKRTALPAETNNARLRIALSGPVGPRAFRAETKNPKPEDRFRILLYQAGDYLLSMCLLRCRAAR